MVEVFMSASAMCITSHGAIHAQNKSIKPEKKTLPRCSYCNIDFSSTKGKTSRKFAIDNLDKISMAYKCCNRCQIGQLRMPGWQLVFGSTKRRNSFVVISGSETGLVCEEEEVNRSIPQREEDINMSIHKQKLLPWGNLVTQGNDHGMEPTSSSPSSSYSEGRHCMYETKLHYLEERDDKILSRRILSLSRSNKVRSALELFMSMKLLDLRPSTHSCNSLISCLLWNRTLNDAFRVFEVMNEKEMATGHTYSLILKAVANAYGCDSTLKLFMELEGEATLKKNFDPIVYNTMISVCGKARNWVQSERMWRMLKEDGYSGTTVTYCLLVSTFVHCGQTELALDAYHEMIQNGFKPGEDMMKAVIGACSKDGKWDMAYSVFNRMLDSGLKPNAIAFNALINCLGKAGEVDLAFKIYNLMKSSGHTADAYTWNALLSALYRGERYADALRLFESIKREKSSELNAHVYNTVLMSCQRLSLWDRSLQLLWQMEASGMPMSTISYNHVIGACEVARKPKVALQVFEHMIHKKITPDTFTYLSLIRACVWGSLFIKLEEIIEQVPPDATLYNALIAGFCLRGKIASAKKLYMRMRKSGLKPDGKTRALMIQHLPNKSVRPYTRYPSRSRH